MQRWRGFAVRVFGRWMESNKVRLSDGAYYIEEVWMNTMLERYSRPEMRAIWTEENKFKAWLEVEICACEAWSELGVIPAEDVAALRERPASTSSGSTRLSRRRVMT